MQRLWRWTRDLDNLETPRQQRTECGYDLFMQLNRVLEQHIAVFGESGSGKTVLVSSFYGATQEPDFLQGSLFDVTADETGQGHRLHANYLGMRDSARPPEPTRFASTSYAFSVKLRDRAAKALKSDSFDAVRLVWHDYPGEWFEQGVSGQEEAQRRVETFKALLGADVAFLLVDGQRLLDHAGEEGRYLKSLFGSYRTGLLRLKDELLDEGNPLVKFPRIWVLALSKADLLPEVDVFAFRDLVIQTAGDDLSELRKVVEGIVEAPEALSIGEDFVRLSSARFEPKRIEVTERIGVDLILPMAAMLPFERHLKWVDRKQIPTRVVSELLDGTEVVAAAILGTSRVARLLGKLDKLGLRRNMAAAIGVAAKLGGEQLKKLNAEAAAKRDNLAIVLTRFHLDLEDAESKRVLLRSKK